MRSDRPNGFIAAVALLLRLALLLVALASFGPLLSDRIPLLAMLEPFALQLAAASIALTVLTALFRPRSWALLGLAAVGWNVLLLWPFLPLASSEVAVADAAPRLKVISINVWYRNDDYAPTVNYLTARDPDVIGLVEVTPQWLEALQPLYARYPYRVDCMQRIPPCEIMLMSKYPFAESYAGRINDGSPSIAWGKIVWQGRSITVAETHLAWPLAAAVGNAEATVAATLRPEPLAGAPPLLQSQQAQNLAEYLTDPAVAGPGPNLVLMGDFNSVPWSRMQNALRRATGLDDVGPAAPTWPSWLPPWLRLPIDHVFVRGALRRVGFRSGNYVGSDHLPVEAEIALKP